MPENKYSTGDLTSDPSRNAFAVTPSDTVELITVPKALFIGGAGNVVLRSVEGAADVTIAATAGMLLPIRARFVRATGTTATGIVALA